MYVLRVSSSGISSVCTAASGILVRNTVDEGTLGPKFVVSYCEPSIFNSSNVTILIKESYRG